MLVKGNKNLDKFNITLDKYILFSPKNTTKLASLAKKSIQRDLFVRI
tara:strand:- start:74 stop:214 length:141 start_codon:yes stop_codon:yes gene_type:complete